MNVRKLTIERIRRGDWGSTNLAKATCFRLKTMHTLYLKAKCRAMRYIFFILFFIMVAPTCSALDSDSLLLNRKRLNIVLSNKASSLDPASMSFHSQAWWNQLFHRNRFRFIKAKTIDEAVTRISMIMKKENARIGTLWFDSHAYMARRVSLLELGDVELNYESIKEPWINEKLSAIGKYCDSITAIVLGSCYSGASYHSPGIDRFPSRRMNGDSLMRQIAYIMNHATVYGSVSWVTTKPGLFNARHASAGNPIAKRFKDPKFKHAWDSLGVWKVFKPGEEFRYVNTVSLNHNASIHIADKAFLDIPRNKKKQYKKSKRLKEGNFNDKYFYRYKDPLHLSNLKIRHDSSKDIQQ